MQIQTKEIKMIKFIDTELESKSELESYTEESNSDLESHSE